ncbi:hypothetical protein WISP_91467 [Willisornis vidua]|uniref:Uncharacterized protein n=1 Tax=Willisornis vidua TaxID=1566151 RepID=A0ABQ9D108_9PASS|nr:hypothetical protein WISP_91467 [Willisornis vidua]
MSATSLCLSSHQLHSGDVGQVTCMSLLGCLLCRICSSPASCMEQLEVIQHGAAMEKVPSHPNPFLIKELKAKVPHQSPTHSGVAEDANYLFGEKQDLERRLGEKAERK